MDRFDLTGRHFGRLTVLRRSGTYYEPPCGYKTPEWICYCDPALGGCGQECVVQSKNLLNNRTRSCGCLRKENMRRLNAERVNRRMEAAKA